MALQNQKQLGILDENIHAMKAQAASKGLLKSGATIKEVKNLCVKVLESRVDYISEILRDLPFKYSRDLGTKVSQISLKYFPADLGELRTRLEDIIRLANGEHARELVLGEVEGANNTKIRRFRTKLDQFLLTLKKSKKVSTFDKIVFFLEAICLLATAFLAGKWSSDPSRLYQPYIIVVGVMFSLLEIIRRIVKRS